LYDHPEGRKIHDKKILKVGGIGIIFSFFLVLFAYRIFNGEYIFLINSIQIELGFSLFFLIAGGLVDDFIGLNASRKLFFQLISIGILLYSGISLPLIDSYVINSIVNIIIYILIINSMNLIDGIDGLSCGIFIILSGAILYISSIYLIIDAKYYIVISIFIGTVVAFFRQNSPPATIFLGDVGSQLFGWIAAVSIFYLSSIYTYNYQKIYLLSFLSIPLYDVLFVMLVRFYNYKGNIIDKFSRVVKSDQNHIHHIIIKNEKLKKYALTILLSLFFCFTMISLIPILYDKYYRLVFYSILFSYILIRLNLKSKLTIDE